MQCETVEIKFRTRLTRAVLSFLSVFANPFCQGRMGLLKWALTDESYNVAVMNYADVIVSCGSALSGVNKLLKIENYCRNVAVLDPGKFMRKYFDLIITPRHDSEKGYYRGDNVVVTDLAPNLIDPGKIRAMAEEKGWSDRKKSLGGPCVGLLFGGDNEHFVFTAGLSEEVAKNLIEACRRVKGYFFATTSRRTPDGAEEALKRILSSDPANIGLVSGRTDDDPLTVEKILSLSDVVIVSGESISMVSEAVSSGKHVLVFMPEKKFRMYTKYERFIKGLVSKNYVNLLGALGDIPGKVEDAVKLTVGNYASVKKDLPTDRERIYEKLYKLF